MTAAAVVFLWPQVDRIARTGKSEMPAAAVNEKLEKAQLKAERFAFENEFSGLLAMEPVDRRRERLAAAEVRLRQVVGPRVDVPAGWLYAEASDEAVRFDKRLAAAKGAAVGVIDNKCDSKIEIEGRVIYAGAVECIAFEDGNPAAREILKFGCEPRALPGDFDGKTLILTNDDFLPAPVVVAMPEDMDESVSCWFDGKQTAGPLKLKPQATPYRCVFRKRGYDDKIRTFGVALGTDMRLAKLDAWVASPVEVGIGDLEAGVACLVDGKPAAGKVALNPGPHVVKYTRHGYEDLAADFTVEIGTARAAPCPAEVGMWKMAPVRVTVPDLEAGVRCIVDGHEERRRFRDMLPGKHVCRYERTGYRPQTDITFSVVLATPTNLPAPGKWVAEKVKVTIPRLSDVEARLGGQSVSGVVSLMPEKTYWMEYVQKSTGKRQSVPFIVQNNTPMTAPVPLDSNWIDARPGTMKTSSHGGQVSERARREYETASEYYELESYGESFDHFYQAFKAGYPMNDEDMRAVERAYKDEYGVLKGLIEEWKHRPAHNDSHRKIEELNRQLGDIIRKHREICGR